MRVDPETVYLEINPSAMLFNMKTGKDRFAPAVVVHWKPEPRPGTKWRRASILADADESLGNLLARVGEAVDADGGLDGLLTRLETVTSGR